MPHRTPRLLDRDSELEALGAAIRDATASGRGTVAVIEGNAGMGKSTLVARAGAGGTTARVLSACGGELEQEHPFGVIRQLYEPVLREVDRGERERLLQGAAAPAAHVLGLRAADRVARPPADGFGAMNALHWLAAELAAAGPIILTIDDAHWADASSLRSLEYQARRIDDLPVALVIAFRPDEPGSHAGLLDGLRACAHVRIQLSALHAGSVATIVREWIPGATEETCAAYHAATAGNPLYLAELLRAIPVNGSPPAVEVVHSTSVPFLADRVLRRVGRVDDSAATLARALAVLGDGARLGDAAAVAELDLGHAGAIAHELRRIEILVSEDPVGFVHPLIRSSIYDTISAAERVGAHRRAADVLAAGGARPEVVGAHLARLIPDGDPDVARRLAAIAEDALVSAAPAEAVVWLQRALTEDAPEPPRRQLLARLGAAQAMLRDPAAVATLEQAAELAEDPRQRVELGVLRSELLGHAGQWRAAIEALDAVDGVPGDLEVELAALRAVISLNDPTLIGDFDRHRARYLELSLQDGWAADALTALLSLEASGRGRIREGLALAERAHGDGRLLRERGGGAWAAPQLLGAFVLVDALDRAEALLGELDASARSSGATLASMTAIGYRGWVHARRGNLIAAEADLLASIGFARSAELLMGLTTAAHLFTDVVVEREGLESFAELIEQTELPEDFLATNSGAMLLEARGRLRVAHRDRASGIADLRAAGAIVFALGYGPTYSTWRSALALALGPEDRDEARSLAAGELALARGAGLKRPLGVALRTAGMLADERDEGIELLRESVAVLERSPARLEEGRSLVELGAALRRGNRRADARAPLVAGLRLARECGAERLRGQAEHELHAAGGRLPRLVQHGRDGLTASERRVAELAVVGATNTQIAQELFVSVKTIETHLSRAYLKLGLSGSGSRSRLAEVL
jgi:DNA-binding CsgD family transcriptional regulator